MNALRQLVRDGSLSAVLAGCIATLISFAGPLVIVFQAAKSLPPAVLESWVWTIAVGSGVLGIVLSLRYKVPVIIAWSAPGSALLISLLPGVDYPAAIGAYLAASFAIFLIGITGTFDNIVSKLPAGISAAMLAGILFGFTAKLFVVLPEQPALVGAMFVAFFIGRRLFPRYAVVGVLIAGVLISVASGKLTGHPPSLKLTSVVWTSPRFDWQSIVNISLPLVVVALTGQWVPGVAVMRNAGYTAPSAGPVIVWSSALSALLAPFGCHGLNLASITAAICTGPEAHEDPAKRYIAGISGGALYVVLGAITATVLSLFAILPPALIAALAGLALFPTIAGALAASMVDTAERDGALVTFVVSASGMSLLGLGAAFWGLLFGVAVHALLRWRRVHVSSAQDRFGDGRS